MTVYSKLTQLALQSGEPDAAEAWEASKTLLSDTYSEMTLNKGCPRAAFVGLAGAGHVKGLSSTHAPNENSKHALSAYALLAVNPELRDNKTLWWHAVQQQRRISRRNQNGVLDVLLALVDEGRFQP